MKTATTIHTRGHAAVSRREALIAAKLTGNDIAFGVQRNDVTGRLEPGYIPANWADAPGMLEEVHGIAYPDGGVVERIDKVPGWRKAGAK